MLPAGVPELLPGGIQTITLWCAQLPTPISALQCDNRSLWLQRDGKGYKKNVTRTDRCLKTIIIAACFVCLNTKGGRLLIRIFSPSVADAANTNAQNLTVKEIVSRLSPQEFHVTMIAIHGPLDPRLAARPNTCFLRWRAHGNTLHTLLHTLIRVPDIYFYPRETRIEDGFLFFRRVLKLQTALVTHVVMCLEGYEPSRTLVRTIREADAVAGVSRRVTEILSQKYAIVGRTIYDGVDTRFFHCRNRPASQIDCQELTVLYAGSFQRRKRVDLVIQEAAKWPAVNFRLAGCGAELEMCRTLAAKLGCTNVWFLGHVSSEQLGREMRAADVFLFPSILEGHPQVLGQAAASGLPAIAMRVYRPDYVVDGVSGFLCNSDAEVSERLGTLLQSAELRQSMSVAASKHSRRFDWDVIVREWETVFEEVMARRSGP